MNLNNTIWFNLQVEYSQKGSTHRFIRKVLALPFLPVEQITQTFNTLKDTVDTEKITKLKDYINNTWINGSTWKPASWTVYRVSEDKQWRWRLAPPAQQESTETKLADVHSHRTTAPCKGSQITTDSTQDGHRGKTSTLPKKENQGAASTGFSLCRTSTVKMRSLLINYWRNAARFMAASNWSTLYLLCYFVYL